MKVLHAGCGLSTLPPYLSGYDETRLDIDPTCEPDVVAPITNMGNIGTFDILYTAHCLEHLYPHQVADALREFRRVTDGAVIVIVPDIEGVQPTTDVLFKSPAGPICGLDLLYGKHDFIQDNIHMAHHCGFTGESLYAVMEQAGFTNIRIMRPAPYDLGVIADTNTRN